MKRNKTCVTRKIHFYKIYAGNNMAGEPLEYDVKTALEAIGKLSFQTADRYLKDEEDGFEICCWVDGLDSPCKVTFGKIKRDDFPQIEREGILTDLSVPEESGLVECVHVVFFPNNIVGIEYNFDGPRIARISEYLHAKSQNACPQVPVFEQLLQRDAIKKLEQMQVVKQFKLKVRESLFGAVKQADEDLENAFQAARGLGQAKEIELILSVGRGKGTLGAKVLNIAKKLISLKNENYDVISGQIKGCDETGKVEIIDLLNAKLVAEKCIPRPSANINASQSELFYSAIEEAYKELKDQLIDSLGVTLCPV